ncbi:hypothetical protein M758_4G005600 [Ceratodon purpureus]|nr:hypothetical protein M758_4G005600 [Ceratodon purpureus]
MQGLGLGPQPPSIPIPNVVVDDPEVGKIYWIYLKYPHDLNDDLPLVSISIPSSRLHLLVATHEQLRGIEAS